MTPGCPSGCDIERVKIVEEGEMEEDEEEEDAEVQEEEEMDDKDDDAMGESTRSRFFIGASGEEPTDEQLKKKNESVRISWTVMVSSNKK